MSTYPLSTALISDLSLQASIDLIRGAGFEEIELSGADWDRWMETPQELARALEDAGIRPVTVHTPPTGWHNGSEDDDERARAFQICAHCLSLSAQVGAEIVICHSNSGEHCTYDGAHFAANWARSRESIERLAERAAAAGVHMAVENLPAYGAHRPATSVRQVLAMIDGLGDHVGICLDAGHSNANGISAAYEVLEAGDKLFALHIQDNDGKGEDQHIIPGQGTTDWEAFLDALDQIHFAGPRTFEVMRGAERDVILETLSQLASAWNQR